MVGGAPGHAPAVHWRPWRASDERSREERLGETDRLAYGVMDAFEGIPELELEWLTVPDDPGREDAVVELEVSATEAFLAGTDIGPGSGCAGRCICPWS